MKKLLFISILIFHSFFCSAQTELSTSFNNSHTGFNQSFLVCKKINAKIELGGGLIFNINRIAHPDNQYKIFYKRLYATKPIHYLGGEAYVNRFIFQDWKKVEPFVFYNMRMTYSTTRNVMKNNTVKNFGPFIWLTQYLGVGYKVDLFNSLYLTHKVGFGVGLILLEDDELFTMFDGFEWEFASIHSFGIGYRF